MDLKEIEKYISDLYRDEDRFKQVKTKTHHKKRLSIESVLRIFSKRAKFLFLSMWDYVLLKFLLQVSVKSISDKRIVFTAKSFCTVKEGALEDRIVKPLFTENILFINQSKEYSLKRINGQRVYNLGGIVKLVSLIAYKGDSQLMRTFRAYRAVNDSILKYLNDIELYMLCFYDLNSFALIFSKFRMNIKLVEVQHGSIINYPPYAKPAPIRIADIFYVKNKQTIEYLKTHLNSNFSAEYRLMPYPKRSSEFVPGLHLLYASTLEFNGIHSVLLNFLMQNSFSDLHLIIRLHPRERDKESIFAKQLVGLNVNFEFDHSKDWLEDNTISNLIVISPWSSTLEDAYDNGFVAITIDEVGKERFNHYIDNARFFYSDNLEQTLSYINGGAVTSRNHLSTSIGL